MDHHFQEGGWVRFMWRRSGWLEGKRLPWLSKPLRGASEAAGLRMEVQRYYPQCMRCCQRQAAAVKARRRTLVFHFGGPRPWFFAGAPRPPSLLLSHTHTSGFPRMPTEFHVEQREPGFSTTRSYISLGMLESNHGGKGGIAMPSSASNNVLIKQCLDDSRSYFRA